MFSVTCSSTSSMKTVSLPLLLRPQPANRWRRRLRGSPQRAPCPLSRSRLRRSQTGRLKYGRRDQALFPRLTILLWSGRGVSRRSCAPSWRACRLTCENLETTSLLTRGVAQSLRVGSSQAHQDGSVVSLNLSSVSSTHPSLLPGPQTLLLTLPLPPSLALTVAIPPHIPSVC